LLPPSPSSSHVDLYCTAEHTKLKRTTAHNRIKMPVGTKVSSNVYRIQRENLCAVDRVENFRARTQTHNLPTTSPVPSHCSFVRHCTYI